MCGICGYAGIEDDGSLLRRMTGVIRHRGPDEDGHFQADSVGLGIRRLSIIDVEGGHQPVFNEDRTIALVFNGEIYNFLELRRELEAAGHQFATDHSDSETIVHLYEEHGVDCPKFLRGMFAFALYDIPRRRLFIARDRMGIKPLYLWRSGDSLIFGSEIKSILESPDVPRVPDLPSIDAYLSLRYVPGPETLFRGIQKFPAAHRMILENGHCRIEPYWAVKFEDGPSRPDAEYQERFDELLDESIRMRMIADVPLGGFLSGGLDSSACVATMSRHADRAVQTFSVGFDWEGDELAAVRDFSSLVPIDSHEVICKPDDMELLPRVVWHLDEPVGDAIVLPMYLLSRLAREHVKVVLSGEGADETLAGYLYHRVIMLTQRYGRWVPRPIRTGLIHPLAARAPLGLLNALFDYPAALGGRGRQKLLDYHERVGRGDLAGEYQFLISLFDDRDKAGLYGSKMLDPKNRWQPDFTGTPPAHTDLDRMLGLQYAHWLPDDILMKQDKMSMANSVEARIPFLDHHLVEFLATVPPHLKLSLRRNKVLLREYTRRLLPPEFAGRRKKAFYIPLDRYLETPFMQGLVNDLLSPESIRRRGYFDPEAIGQLRAGSRDNDFLRGKQIFALLMLELWHRIFIDREAGWIPSP